MRKMMVVALLLLAAQASRAALPPALPPVVLTELKALEETYGLLDAVAGKVWPGWIAYRDMPFLFTFENDLQVLVGHPNPPKGFEWVEDVRVGDRRVAVGRTQETAVPLKGPLAAGGGLMSFAGVDIVEIHLRTPRPTDLDVISPDQPRTTEHKILVYLHELFHRFQRGWLHTRSGNLRYNPDAGYATWSNIEGLALIKAYGETDAARARDRMKDFLVARALKRRSMTDEQANEESATDLSEGTANYAMVRALEVIKADGYRPKLTPADDPDYHGFANVDALMQEYRIRLEQTAGKHEDPWTKCYDYGCFESLMCQRIIPGWQQALEKGQSLEEVLSDNLPLAAAERAQIQQRLAADYPLAAIRANAMAFVLARDAAWVQIKSRKGRTYVLDLKPTGKYLDGLADPKGAVRLGLMTLFGTGYPGFTLDEIEMSRVGVPSTSDQLYYVRAVDTKWRSRKQACSVSSTKQADGTYVNAIVTTPLFTVKAPRIRIKETATRVKIQVLARVADKRRE